MILILIAIAISFKDVIRVDSANEVFRIVVCSRNAEWKTYEKGEVPWFWVKEEMNGMGDGC
jgi:hypothetical protein